LADRDKAQPVAVIGLGRFGGATARSLIRMGHEVLAIDQDMDTVQLWSEELSHVVQADSTNATALKRLGLHEIPHVVVGIGSDIEASLLTVLALTELKVPRIWAKAVSANHGHILKRIGADEVVYPEAAMGERVAHLVTGKMIDFIEFDDGFAIVKTRTPRYMAGRSLAETDVRKQHGITIVGIKRPGQDFTYATPETVAYMSDLLIVSGPTEKVERFAAMT
jgi:trk system potassium uptake protein TrkA